MIKYKRGLAYNLSERTWELMSEKSRKEFSDEGGNEIHIEEIPLEASNLPKHDIEIIDLEESDIKKVATKPKRKPRKKKANDSSTQKN